MTLSTVIPDWRPTSVNPDAHRRVATVLGLAILLTTAAELFYLVVWGMVLFPDGSLPGKLAWTLTCGLAMGSVMGAMTLILAEPRQSRAAAFWIAAGTVALVGSYCAWLCSRIDARFDYFGGPEHGALFVASGVIPAVIGGLLYAWLLYGRSGPPSNPS
ncbi:hypothetical protein [Pseudaestuariivita atlantica]|uniref:Uncharacterized protein n=1 Tax=Pseudaestuariivita atlantica TaxID=1317121 RepID=A0A0L1JS46_9RHOB|nr:hypothetical protein [Pseudaestuariivita atlantica]KNG94570.1 hypothetical protein ATO11_03955 [Pseudaestuariivita atlantica]